MKQTLKARAQKHAGTKPKKSARRKLIASGKTKAVATKQTRKRASTKAGVVARKGLVYRVVAKKAAKALIFGSVKLEGVMIKSHRAGNIESGRVAMREVADLVTPGVTLRMSRDVPRYFADKNDPNAIVRVLHGRQVRGRFINGRFQPT